MNRATWIAVLMLMMAAWVYSEFGYSASGDVTPVMKTFNNYSAAGGKISPTAKNDTIKLLGSVTANASTKTLTFGNYTTHAADIDATWTTPAYSSGDFTANGSMTWTVDSGDVSAYQYIIIGKMMTVNFNLNLTTIGGTVNNRLYIAIPASKTSATYTHAPVYTRNSTKQIGFAQTGPAGTKIFIYKDPNTNNWIASTNDTDVCGQITFEIQ